MSKNETANVNSTETGLTATADNAGFLNRFGGNAGSFVNRLPFTEDFLKTEEGQMKLYKTINSPDVRLSKQIGKTINICGFYVHMVEVNNENTGEVTTQPRVIVMDEAGVSYECVSLGIANELSKLAAAFSFPRVDKGLPIKVVTKKSKRGSYDYTTFELVC